MRYVLQKHLQSLGFIVDVCASYEQASESLTEQFRQFGSEYGLVVLGWPTTAQSDADAFAQKLESGDHKDLPVVVMSTDMRAETKAWVGSRDKSAILAWKSYQDIAELLTQLIDTVPVEPAETNDAASAISNDDIHLLVVDDSATIRFSLRDLFQTHGYRVTLCATRDEALEYATSERYDIAVLDYYLSNTTGDALCRELLASEQTGDIVCTVLTGTYSDHIIKRSLRAGAVECMFKNESSELLLSRIDAISRFVRQKRQLNDERALLADVLENIAGAVIIIDSDKRITYVNELALAELGAVERSSLVGNDSHTLLEADGPKEAGANLHEATWTLSDGNTLDVDYQHSLINGSGYSLLRFTQRVVSVDAKVLADSNLQSPTDDASTAIAQFSIPDSAQPFLQQMHTYLQASQTGGLASHDSGALPDALCSLLVLDVFVIRDNQRQVLDKDSKLGQTVHNALGAILTRENHVAVLGDNRFGFLLRHSEDSQSYIMARKVMQKCLSLSEKAGAGGVESPGDLSCSGSLVSLNKHQDHPVPVLIQHVYNGMDLINQKKPDQVLLMDIRRLLSAYPTAVFS